MNTVPAAAVRTAELLPPDVTPYFCGYVDATAAAEHLPPDPRPWR